MSEEGTRATRRTMLRSGLLAIGGLAGLFGMAGLAERARSGTAVQANPAGTTLTVYGSEWRLAAPGLRRGDLPQRQELACLSGVCEVDFAPQGNMN